MWKYDKCKNANFSLTKFSHLSHLSHLSHFHISTFPHLLLIFALKFFVMRNNHEIDYKIFGEELQFVEVELDPGETVIGEPGGFMMMDDGIEMQTLFGDGSAASQQGGLLGR